MTRGLAGLKFSGSLSKVGESRTIPLTRANRTINPVISLVEK